MKKIFYTALSLCIIAIGTTACKKDKTTTETKEMHIEAGQDHTLVLKTESTLWVCGNNTYGQLGDGSNENRHSLVPVFYLLLSLNNK